VVLTPSENAKRETAQQITQSTDSSDFEALDRLMRPKLLRVAWLIVRDWSLAADAVQSAFLTLHQKWSQILPENRSGWLVKAVQYSAQNIRRSQGRHDQVAAMLFKRPTVSPLDHNSIAEKLSRLQIALEKLPKDQRQVIQLRLVEGATFKEIADRLMIPIGTALSRMRLAIGKLKSEVNEIGSE
jgi:RNA polymerase sigma-70 factor, ECF subfamily